MNYCFLFCMKKCNISYPIKKCKNHKYYYKPHKGKLKWNRFINLQLVEAKSILFFKIIQPQNKLLRLSSKMTGKPFCFIYAAYIFPLKTPIKICICFVCIANCIRQYPVWYIQIQIYRSNLGVNIVDMDKNRTMFCIIIYYFPIIHINLCICYF